MRARGFRVAFHSERPRGDAELAGVIAALAWKRLGASIGRLRAAGFDIDVGAPYFAYACEFLAFLAHAADRIAHRELAPGSRERFTRALFARLADIVADNGTVLLGEDAHGRCRSLFVEILNAAGAEYAHFDYDGDGPDFAYRRCFAARVAAVLPEKDRFWIADQIIAIETPQEVAALERALAALLHPAQGVGQARSAAR